MTPHDVYLLSPELSLAALGGVVILVDLVVHRKEILPFIVVIGLSVPFAFSIGLLGSVYDDPARAMSGISGSLVVDQFSLFFKFLVLGILALVVMGSVDYVSRFKRFQGEYYALIIFSAGGMMLLASTTELISIYIALELTALPLAALAAFLGDAKSSEAGLKFFIISAISSALMLYGFAFVFGFTGTTELTAIAQAIAQPHENMSFGSYPVLMGVILVLVGFGFKISAVPFQMWAPDVYEGAPTPIVAYLSVASKAAGCAVLLRVFYIAFGAVSLDWATLLAALSVLSMTIGNLVAIVQSNIKRMLGYSTIAHAGYILVGLAAVAARANDGNALLGPGSVLFYLAAYAVTNLSVFFAVSAISSKVNSDMIDGFAGMGRQAPWLAAILTLGMISLIGIPPTAGFMGKLFLFSAAVNADLIWLALVGAVNSVLSAYYYLRVIKVMYLHQGCSDERVLSSVPFRIALGLSAAGVLLLGIAPGPLMDASQIAVTALLP